MLTCLAMSTLQATNYILEMINNTVNFTLQVHKTTNYFISRTRGEGELS